VGESLVESGEEGRGEEKARKREERRGEERRGEERRREETRGDERRREETGGAGRGGRSRNKTSTKTAPKGRMPPTMMVVRGLTYKGWSGMWRGMVLMRTGCSMGCTR
jgi:hypothetical protein